MNSVQRIISVTIKLYVSIYNSPVAHTNLKYFLYKFRNNLLEHHQFSLHDVILVMHKTINFLDDDLLEIQISHIAYTVQITGVRNNNKVHQ